MGCAADGGVDFHLLLCDAVASDLRLGLVSQLLLQGLQPLAVTLTTHLHNLVVVLTHQLIEGRLDLLHLQLLGELTQLALVIHLTPDDIELRTAAATLGIDLVALTGCGQGTTLVEEVVLDLGLKGVVGTAHAQHLADRGALRVGVAALNHKALDDTMEQGTVIIALAHQFDEVITVNGGLVIKANHDVAEHCLYLYFHSKFEVLISLLATKLAKSRQFSAF